jgi:hypothetical protein
MRVSSTNSRTLTTEPTGRELAGADDDESFGQEHIGSGSQPGRIDFGGDGHAHAAAADDDVGGHTLDSSRPMRVPQLFGGSVRRRASSLIRLSSSRAVRRVFDKASLRLPAV